MLSVLFLKGKKLKCFLCDSVPSLVFTSRLSCLCKLLGAESLFYHLYGTYCNALAGFWSKNNDCLVCCMFVWFSLFCFVFKLVVVRCLFEMKVLGRCITQPDIFLVWLPLSFLFSQTEESFWGPSSLFLCYCHKIYCQCLASGSWPSLSAMPQSIST